MENQENSSEMEGKNCEILDSWELLKEQEADEGIEPLRNTSEIIHQSEDSDGISVISESELGKTMSENELEKAEETATDDEKLETAAEFVPLTPPATPTVEVVENAESEPCFIHNNPRNFVFGAGLFVIIAILYSHINGLRNDIQKCDQRLQRLEEENQMLKTALEQLERLNQPVVELSDASEVDDELILSSLYEDEPRKPPPTKTVWLGSETEHKVEILDKRHELPDFCFHTPEDDLFYEYNQELCDQKRRKLEKSKTAKDFSKKKDKKQEWKEEHYDEYIKETLKSLNDEIQDIKRKRVEGSEDSLIEKDEISWKSEKNSRENSKIFREKAENLEKLRIYQESSKNPKKSPENSKNFKNKSINFQEKPRNYQENSRIYRESSGNSQESSGKSEEHSENYQEIKNPRENKNGEEKQRKFQEKSKNSRENHKKPRKPLVNQRGNVESFDHPENSRKHHEKPDYPQNDSTKPRKKKPKRKDRNWLEDRMNGREEARKSHEKEKENEENWYLKRKNERELDRLQA